MPWHPCNKINCLACNCILTVAILSSLQLEKHVSEWKKLYLPGQGGRGGGAGEEHDEDDPLARGLREVSAVEAGILQTNADSLLIIDNISGLLIHMKR